MGFFGNKKKNAKAAAEKAAEVAEAKIKKVSAADVTKLSDKDLVDAVINAEDASVRLQAIDKILNDENISVTVFEKIAIRSDDEDVANKAVLKIEDNAKLKSVSKNAKLESVKQKATEALEEKRKEREKPSDNKRKTARLKRLKVEVDKSLELSISGRLEFAKSELEKLSEKCEEIKSDYDGLDMDEETEKVLASFERAKESFAKRLEEYNQEKISEQAKQEAEKKSPENKELSAREEIKAEVVEGITTFFTSLKDGVEDIEKAKSAWRSLRDFDGAKDSYLSEFKKLCGEEVVEAPKETEEVEMKKLSDEDTAALDSINKEAEFLIDSENKKETEDKFRELHKKWSALVSDLEKENPLKRPFLDARNKYKENEKKRYEERQAKIEESIVVMKEVISEMKSLLDADIEPADLKSKFDDLRQKWRDAGNVPRHKLSELRDEFNELSEKINLSLGDYYRENDWERFGNVTVAERIIKDVEALDLEENAEEGFAKLKELQNEWKGHTKLPREKKDDLWDRYKAATNTAFEKLQPYFDARDGDRVENLKKKELLIEKIIAITDSDGLGGGDSSKSTHIKVKEIEKEWKETGHIPKENMKEIHEKFRNVLNKYYDERRVYFQNLHEEHLDNLGEKEKVLEEQKELFDRLDQWKDKKLPGTSEQDLINSMKDLQQKWRNIGHIPKEKMEEINDSFYGKSEEFYENFKEFFEERNKQYEENLVVKLDILKEMEEILEEEEPRWFKDDFKQLQRKWMDIGYVTKEQSREVQDRYRNVCQKILDE